MAIGFTPVTDGGVMFQAKSLTMKEVPGAEQPDEVNSTRVCQKDEATSVPSFDFSFCFLIDGR